jgi:hypothetical protein
LKAVPNGKKRGGLALRQIVAFSSYASQAIGEHQGMQACGPSPTEFLQQWRPFPVVTDDPDSHKLGAAETMRECRGGLSRHHCAARLYLPGQPLQHRTREQKCPRPSA